MSVFQKIYFLILIITGIAFVFITEEKLLVAGVFIIFILSAFLFLHIRKKRKIKDIPLYGLYCRKDGQLFFRTTNELHVPLEVGFSCRAYSGLHREFYRIGAPEKVNSDEIVVLKKIFKNSFHHDLHLDSDYSYC